MSSYWSSFLDVNRRRYSVYVCSDNSPKGAIKFTPSDGSKAIILDLNESASWTPQDEPPAGAREGKIVRPSAVWNTVNTLESKARDAYDQLKNASRTATSVADLDVKNKAWEAAHRAWWDALSAAVAADENV